jgi:two-component system response regulator PilR (NtrC family)
MSNGSPPSPTPASREAPHAGQRRILVLDDEASMQRLMRVILEGEGYEVVATDDGREALDLVGREPFDLVIQDLRMPKMDGLTFLRLLKERRPEMLSIVVTGYGTWDTAVNAMRLGAYTHLAKPFDTEDFRQLVARALERRRHLASHRRPTDFPLLDIVGNSPATNAVVHLIKRIAATDTTVLLSGESGTGKELVARAIHYNSLRQNGPFVPVNCGAFTETLLESELFGHVKGAFTNAIADRQGLFAAADTGTLFLDEIGEMSPLMQVKLLRVLEGRTYKPVGSSRESRTDVRILAATNRNLAQLMNEGDFREDLYHRLNVIPMALPSLRERREDIPLLAGHFLARYSKRMGKQVTGIEEEALRKLVEHSWPGNVRELENTIERSVALCAGERITEAEITGLDSAGFAPQPAAGAAVFPPVPHAPAPGVLPPSAPTVLPEGGMDLERYLLALERAYIIQALERTEWNMTEAAKLLGMTFRSIRYRVGKLGIERPPR